MDPKLEMTRQWIMRADDDLRLAELIMSDSEPVYWAVAFHAQQCAEKALKGLLTFHDVRAGKTHDIGNLLKLSVSVLGDLEQFKDRAGVFDDLRGRFTISCASRRHQQRGGSQSNRNRPKHL